MKAKFYICEHCSLWSPPSTTGVPLSTALRRKDEGSCSPTRWKPAVKSICRWQAFQQHPHGYGGCGGAPHGGCAHIQWLTVRPKQRTAPLSYPGQSPKGSV